MEKRGEQELISFPITDNLAALMALVMADLSESQRETLMSLVFQRGVFTALTVWVYDEEQCFWMKKVQGPRGYPGGRPGAKASARPSKSWKNTHFGADTRDPKARTSMTPGGG